MQVNRRDADYHQEQPERMEDIDRIAVAILQIAYSGSRAQTFASQGLIQMDCVAVYKSGSEFVVASNTVSLTSEIVLRAWDTLGGRPTRGMTVTIAHGPTGMHAEMKIVSYFIQIHKEMQGLRLGVSKPCCTECAVELDRRGIVYSTTHSTPNRGVWIAPG
ncbi:hypothetical protein [Xanthomonas translucens]|uniref:hypothetical protein n=1 Tax=Xanthomonas campestris pv. translucens TaxID=343 RepID=UPI0009C16D79|nr:hypothetical protein [Xanthomonas translucens]